MLAKCDTVGEGSIGQLKQLNASPMQQKWLRQLNAAQVSEDGSMQHMSAKAVQRQLNAAQVSEGGSTLHTHKSVQRNTSRRRQHRLAKAAKVSGKQQK
jgi:hypothetical protein